MSAAVRNATGAARTRQAGAPEGLAIDIVIAFPLWKAVPRVRAILRRAIGEAAAALPPRRGELSVTLTGDEAVRTLNRSWRGVDKPTNVLAFPAGRSVAGIPGPIGDIIVAYQTVAREAAEQDKPLAHHLAHLAVHGFLHLAGYDHQTDAEAEDMEELEIAVLARLDIPDPYLIRDAETAR